jgi:hypothetical protein
VVSVATSSCNLQLFSVAYVRVEDLVMVYLKYPPSLEREVFNDQGSRGFIIFLYHTFFTSLSIAKINPQILHERHSEVRFLSGQ